MDISVEVCKDTYVASCTPAPPVFLPDCEHGWELGNGTAVCAAQPPADQPLAATGANGGDYVGFGLLALLLVGTGLVMGLRGRKR